MSCGEASFDQACSRTPESASGSSGHIPHRQQSTNSVSSMASNSGLGAESLTTQSLHSLPSSSNHQSPTVKQHDELSISSVDDSLEFRSERDSPPFFCSSPPRRYLASEMPDYETMAPVKSLLTPPRNGLTTLPYQVEDAQHFPETMLNGMKSLNLYDQVVISNPRSNYDNIHLQASQQNYYHGN